MTHFQRRKWWYLGGLAAVVLAASAVVLLKAGHPEPENTRKSTKEGSSEGVAGEEPESTIPRVEVIKPQQGGLAQAIVQPGSADSFESAELYFAKVTGYLDAQYVDIGSVVKRDDLLAVIDVPELTKDVESAFAALQQAMAEVAQAQARIENAIADQKAAEAKISQTKADVERWQAEINYSQSQLERNRELLELKAMPERIVEEKLRQVESAQASHREAQSTVVATEQLAEAARSKIDLARADFKVSEAKVKVAESQLERAKVMASYMKITSPYDGVVTMRSFHRGDFVRAASQGGQLPLLAVDRTDKMRVVVQVPETQVPYVQPGEPATVRFSAFPQRAFLGKVARTAQSESPESRTMRAEIDLPNEDGAIRDRMYGTVEINLPKSAEGVTVPSGCIAGDVINGRAKLFVLTGETVDLREVLVGMDNGIDVEIISGVAANEKVVISPPSGLEDGDKVTSVAAKLTQTNVSSPSH